ncbi:MAG: diguanylate phosphodiesterase, partial [Piscirickettsiaceae bacterium]
PADKIILELLEDIKPNQELNNRIKELVKKGYTIALDDFVYNSEWDTLIDLATIIKLDLTVTTLEENKALIDKLRDKNITFLAEKVETYQQFHEYKDIGCTLFQGYFFCKPERVSGKTIDTSSLARMRLISELNQPDITIDALEQIIKQHPKLTYNLLKYLNSGYFSFSKKPGTIKQCIIILGIEGMKSWSTILCLRNFSSKPAELRHMALIRAKFAELLAAKHKLADPASYFLMGILSTLDALTDATIENILKTMPLDKKIIDALLYQKGEMGQVLATVIKHESTTLSVDNINASSVYSEAYRWADKIMYSIT